MLKYRLADASAIAVLLLTLPFVASQLRGEPQTAAPAPPAPPRHGVRRRWPEGR